MFFQTQGVDEREQINTIYSGEAIASLFQETKNTLEFGFQAWGCFCLKNWASYLARVGKNNWTISARGGRIIGQVGR